MTRMKRKITQTLEFGSGDLTVHDLTEFLGTLPDEAKVTVREAKSYPGEMGITPGYVEVSWDES